MSIGSALLALFVPLFYVCIGSFIVALAIEKSSDAIENVWFSINVSGKKLSKREKLETAFSFVQSVYLDSDEIAHVRLLVFAFIINLFSLVAVVLITIADPEIEIGSDMNEFSYPILIFLGFVGIYINEIIAVKIFIKYYQKSVTHNQYRYLILGVFFISAFLIILIPLILLGLSKYVAPLISMTTDDLAVYALASTQLLAIGTVFFSFFDEHARYLGLIALPGAISIYLPLGILVCGILVSKSNLVLKSLSALIDSKYFRNIKAIRKILFCGVGLLGSSISVIAVDMAI